MPRALNKRFARDTSREFKQRRRQQKRERQKSKRLAENKPLHIQYFFAITA